MDWIAGFGARNCSGRSGDCLVVSAAYVIGIDLGTTNSVLAYAALGADRPDVRLLPIPQLVAAGVVENSTTLPSFVYLAEEHEASAGAFKLPRADSAQAVVGEFARQQSAE